ncbi:MAG: hypothetical protein ABR567_22210 [Myxococcales bacterium]|nr:hypothetical protein [Myxococcales bacterium]
MGRSLVLALLVLASDLPGAAAPAQPLDADPLVGSWLNLRGDALTGTGAVCDFFPNQAWNGDCMSLYGVGSPTTWERLGDRRYFFGTTGHKCWVDAAFSDGGEALALTLYCGTYRPTWMGNVEPPAPLTRSANLVRFRYR